MRIMLRLSTQEHLLHNQAVVRGKRMRERGGKQYN